MSHRVDYVSDWVARLKGRLYTQFRNKVTWDAWCELLGRQFQDLEDSAQSLLSMFDVDEAEGVQLDLIGRLVGQPRLGAGDDAYRLYLRARIAANRSRGTTEDIYTVFRAMLTGAVGLQVLTSDVGVKAFVLRLKDQVTRMEALVGGSFLRVAKEAGARALLEWFENPVNEVFTFSFSTTAPLGIFAGLGFIQAESVEGFPETGSLILGPGTSLEETVTYQAIFRGVSPPLFVLTGVVGPTNSQAVGTIIERNNAEDGLGYDEGYYAGALQA